MTKSRQISYGVLPIGSDGQTLVANSANASGLGWQPLNAAGKNAIINGGMDIWQRGTSATGAGYLADRWYRQSSAGTTTFARESTIVPSGSQYAMKWTQSVANAYANIIQVIETANAIQFAGKTVTLSAQVAASSSQPCTIAVSYSTTVDNTLATGGWTVITATSGGSATPSSTTYTTISGVFAIPSTAKTLLVEITTASIASGVTFYAGNCQLELGSVATTFSRAGGTLQGELGSAERYYPRFSGTANNGVMGQGFAVSTTLARIIVQLPVDLRANPTSIDFSTLSLYDGSTQYAVTGITYYDSTSKAIQCGVTVASGLTANRPYFLQAKDTNTAYIAFNSEL